MKRIILIIISWILVFCWMGVIFWFSSMNGEESTHKSEKAINLVIKKTVEKTNEAGITNKNSNSKKIDEISEELDYPIRKLTHAWVYFILTLLLMNAFYWSNIKNYKLFLYSIIICFLYALSDEFHQSFTERTPSFYDVLIDTFGGLIAISLILMIKKIKKKNISQN